MEKEEKKRGNWWLVPLAFLIGAILMFVAMEKYYGGVLENEVDSTLEVVHNNCINYMCEFQSCQEPVDMTAVNNVCIQIITGYGGEE